MATDSSIEQNPAAQTESGRSRMPTMLVVGFVLAIVLATLAAVFLRGNSAAEAAAAEAIKKTNALVVPDASGNVASVNLSTVETPEALAEAIAQLPALSHVTSLDATGRPVKDEHLEAIGRMAALETLNLTDTEVTDEGVEHLKSLDGITTLFLNGTAITDASMDMVGGLKSLRSVDVSATKVTNNLAPMAELPDLAWLLIRDLTLADGALGQLKGCPKLSHLTIAGSKYSSAELDELKKALPNVAVD
jgi:hypothetical protein